MTIIQAMNGVETLLENRRPCAGPGLVLLARNKELRLVCTAGTMAGDRIIADLTRSAVSEGLTSLQWGRVKHRIRQVIKENRL